MPLRPSVIAKFLEQTPQFEGRVPHMYADILGLITCGVGNLIDPKGAALELPWKTHGGELASSAQVSQEWDHIKAASKALAHRSLAVQATYTSVRLTDADIDELVLSVLLRNAADIEAHYFHDFDSFPADAQLAIMSMAWAVGSGFARKFPTFSKCVAAHDWSGAATNCKIRVGTKGDPSYNPGVIPRNNANIICFANAAAVVANSLPLDVVHWPAFPSAPAVP
jgi:GH24 family phage-related lysozyme (muramidase)